MLSWHCWHFWGSLYWKSCQTVSGPHGMCSGKDIARSRTSTQGKLHVMGSHAVEMDPDGDIIPTEPPCLSQTVKNGIRFWRRVFPDIVTFHDPWLNQRIIFLAQFDDARWRSLDCAGDFPTLPHLTGCMYRQSRTAQDQDRCVIRPRNGTPELESP